MLVRLANNKIVPKLLILAMLYISSIATANAVMITTTDLVSQKQEQIDRNKLLQTLDRAEVKNALIERGVDPLMAKQRVVSMTAEEVRIMNQQLDELPAGAGALELAVIVFLVLLITDIMGYTDIFPFVKKTVN